MHISIDNLQPDFLRRLTPVNNEFDEMFKEALRTLATVAIEVSNLDLKNEKKKRDAGIAVIVKALEWINTYELNEEEPKSDSSYLFDDEYEIVLNNGVMLIISSKYHIKDNGQEVCFLSPECFINPPQVEYVDGP